MKLSSQEGSAFFETQYMYVSCVQYIHAAHYRWLFGCNKIIKTVTRNLISGEGWVLVPYVPSFLSSFPNFPPLSTSLPPRSGRSNRAKGERHLQPPDTFSWVINTLKMRLRSRLETQELKERVCWLRMSSCFC